MDPVVQLHSLVARYLDGDTPLREFEEAFVPLVPFFAEQSPHDAVARLARAIDEILVDLPLSQSSEDDLRAVLRALPALTVDITAPEVPRARSGAVTLDVFAHNVRALSVSEVASHASGGRTPRAAASG